MQRVDIRATNIHFADLERVALELPFRVCTAKVKYSDHMPVMFSVPYPAWVGERITGDL